MPSPRSVLPAALGVYAAATSITAQQWPSFRGPAASGTLTNADLPISWNVPDNRGVRWHTPLPGLSHASPVVWDNRIFVVSAVRLDGQSRVDRQAEGVVFADDTVRHAWRLYALARDTGAIIWERTATESTPTQGRHVRGTYANATPATDGRHLVASLGYEGLFCFTVDGEFLWRTGGLANHASMYDPASSPVIHNGLVFVQNDWQNNSHLAAYRLSDGREVWRQERAQGMTWTSPSIAGSGDTAQLIVNGPQWIHAYEPATGRQLWRLDNRVPRPADRIPTPFASGELIIVAGGGGERPIFAVRTAARGDISPREGATTSDGVAWTTGRGSPYLATPLAHNGLLYAVAQNGVLSVFDLSDGARLYQQRIGGAGSVYSASPVAAGNHVYLTGEDGEVTVIRAGRTFTSVGVNPLGDVAFATPALVPEGLIFRTGSGVVAIGR